jgi:hypothetical protein
MKEGDQVVHEVLFDDLTVVPFGDREGVVVE